MGAGGSLGHGGQRRIDLALEGEALGENLHLQCPTLVGPREDSAGRRQAFVGLWPGRRRRCCGNGQRNRRRRIQAEVGVVGQILGPLAKRMDELEGKIAASQQRRLESKENRRQAHRDGRQKAPPSAKSKTEDEKAWEKEIARLERERNWLEENLQALTERLAVTAGSLRDRAGTGSIRIASPYFGPFQWVMDIRVSRIALARGRRLRRVRWLKPAHCGVRVGRACWRKVRSTFHPVGPACCAYPSAKAIGS
jgi:hypothetical protein